MTTEPKDYRLDGIYRQKQEGYFMQRVKLAAGTISAIQADSVAAIARDFGQGRIHLTSRGNMEIHWIREQDLPEVKRRMAQVGLTARGACGGAVRGVTCAGQDHPAFPLLESMARRIQQHFTGNPRFEGLPKKFKIGIEANTTSRRHLIQDAGLVLVLPEAGCCHFDLWVGGGLGREPKPGLLLRESLPEERVIPVLEALLRVYRSGAQPGKRLKHLLADIGETEFRRRLEAEPVLHETFPSVTGLCDTLLPAESGAQCLEVPCLSGEITTELLTQVARFAETRADGVLRLTADQNISLRLSPHSDAVQAQAEFESICSPSPDEQVRFRGCPGNHVCRVGLSATRDVATTVLKAMGPVARSLSWALSGCHNSCTQPQLADIGIVTSGLKTDETGQKTPRFDLFRPDGEGLNRRAETSLTLEELAITIENIG